MASVIIVMIIFVLLALAILFICQNGGWQGGCGGELCRLPQQMRRSGKEAEEITLTSLCEGGGQEFLLPFCKGSFFLAMLLHKCTKTGILINKYNFREALPMKADKYRFDGARTCDLRALSCDDKEDATDKDEILAKTAENLQKMAALEAER